MKTETKYTFEEGDTVASTDYPWFATRYNDKWEYTDSTRYDTLNDSEVEYGLKMGYYRYSGKWTKDGLVS